MLFLKTVSRVLLAAALFASAGAAQAADANLLSNGSFEEGLANWGQRSQTEGVYQIQSPGHEGKNYARLQVNADSPQRDRQAVYFNRRDLPTAEGYYRLRFAVRSALQQGKGGARVVNFDGDTKVLSTFAPGGAGIPFISGTTPWTEYSYV